MTTKYIFLKSTEDFYNSGALCSSITLVNGFDLHRFLANFPNYFIMSASAKFLQAMIQTGTPVGDLNGVHITASRTTELIIELSISELVVLLT